MKKIRRQVVSTLGCSYPVLLILLLVGLFAALAPHSFHNVSVTHAQSETEAPLPGGGGDAGGPAAPVVTGTAYSAPDFVGFTWERVEGAEEYEVLWRRGAGGTWAHVAQSPFASTAYDFYQESAGTTLSLLVRAIAADGKVSAWSNLAQATVPGTPTQTPTATATVSTQSAPRLSARNGGANAIDLSWTPVTGAVRYVLFRQEVADPGWQQIDDGNLRGTSFTDGGLTPGVTYQYAVGAIDANGQPLGPWSNFPTATVPESGASTLTPTPTVTSTPTSGPTQTPTATATVSTQSGLRGWQLQNHVQDHSAQYYGTDFSSNYLGDGPGHFDRGGPKLSRTGHSATHGHLGNHVARCPKVSIPGSLVHPGPWYNDLRRHPCSEFLWRQAK